MPPSLPLFAEQLPTAVSRAVREARVFDIHTHLYAPAFGDLLLWGIDDLLVFHYLVAETFRHAALPYERFWGMSKSEQAELVWGTLFLDRSPLSEARQGVLTTLHALGLDVRARDLPALRRHFAGQNRDAYIGHCMELAGVSKICMTNSPFDHDEAPLWDGFRGDERFCAALRIDPLLNEWEQTLPQMRGWGYDVGSDLNEATLREVRRFLGDWARKMNALYLMVSLPPEWNFPDDRHNPTRGRLIEGVILPFCREAGLPFAVMPGVRKLINPDLRLAGDGVGRSDLYALGNLCAHNPDVKFMATVLSRENQHELNVLARKFGNLHPFGCWWFLNIPTLVDEMTRMRLELLGTSFTFQHSDARVLEQMIYKWDHSKTVLERILSEKYAAMTASGWGVTAGEIERDVREITGGAFEEFLARS